MRRSQSRSILPAVLFTAAMTVAAACGSIVSPDTGPVRAGSLADARGTQGVCHPTGNGNYVLITLGNNGAAAHWAHGDGSPGIPVPGTPDMKFGANCEPVPRFTDIAGTWQGTYSWNCGGTRTGSTELILQLEERGNGFVYGIAIYLGDDPELLEYDSYRMINPMYRANGTLLGGTPHPDGMVVRLSVGASSTNVYNQFDGTISPNFMTMTGGTLNGDSPTPGSMGCSAATGYSGSFTVTHVN